MSKIIPKEDLGGYNSWQPPTMGGSSPSNKNISVLTAKQIDQIQRQAHEEGFAHGRAEGLASVKTPIEAVLRALGEPLAELDARAIQELSLLIAAIARQLVRRELKTNPDEIVGVVRETLSALPAAARHVRVHLHPEDAALVRSALSLGEGERHWQIVEDPVLTRGGCRVYAEASQIDASVESRLAAVIAKMLGGERENDTRPV
jgi:flagellar assembly protein FliH